MLYARGRSAEEINSPERSRRRKRKKQLRREKTLANRRTLPPKKTNAAQKEKHINTCFAPRIILKQQMFGYGSQMDCLGQCAYEREKNGEKCFPSWHHMKNVN
jgi:hypothetical protein